MLTDFLKECINALMRLHHETGQNLTEYALILVLIAVATVAAVTALGCRLSMIFMDLALSL